MSSQFHCEPTMQVAKMTSMFLFVLAKIPGGTYNIITVKLLMDSRANIE